MLRLHAVADVAAGRGGQLDGAAPRGGARECRSGEAAAGEGRGGGCTRRGEGDGNALRR